MSKLRLCAALTLGTDGHSLNERMLFLADLARAVLAKSKTSENKIYAPNFREARGARASAINWPIARAVLAKSRLVIRQNATSGNLCPGVPRGERARYFGRLSARGLSQK